MEKSKIKLYIYPHATKHVHDDPNAHHVNGVSQYINTVPLSQKGITEHFEIVSPDQAEYFYMGQFPDYTPIPEPETFTYFKGNEHKHICDIEGDWRGRTLPEWLKNSILTINGARKEYEGIKMFVRPTFSFLLVDIAKHWPKTSISFNSNLKFGFKGTPDPHGVRIKMKEAFDNSGLEGIVTLNSTWMAQNLPSDDNTISYIQLLLNNTFSLCPMGAGFDSIRFFESCFFARIPVVISSIFVPYEKEFNKPFFFQIDYNLPSEEISRKLVEIQNTNIETLKEMSYNAKEYFETYIKEYFSDPTLSFIKWLKQNEY